MTQCCKETTAAKKIQKTLSQKLASTQTLGSAFLERIQKVQDSKYETNFLKIFDCFIDGYATAKK